VKGWLRYRLVIKSRVCYVKVSCWLVVRVRGKMRKKPGELKQEQ
jgi:hypothetical protein